MNNLLRIQDALPALSTDQRETLMTGLCTKCWEDIFETDEEEEDDGTDQVRDGDPSIFDMIIQDSWMDVTEQSEPDGAPF